MRKLLAFLLVLAILLPVNLALAADRAVYAGAGHDDGLAIAAGIALPVGSNFWIFQKAQLGLPYGDLGVEAAYIIPIKAGFAAGVTGGPDVDIDVVTYVVGASGLIVTYSFETFGLWALGKYKASFQGDDHYVDGWVAGGGIFIGF